MWMYLSAEGMSMRDTSPDVPMWTSKDEMLIMAFFKAGHTGKLLRHLNLCRLHLQASTVADLTDASATGMRDSAWNGMRDRSCSSNTIDWPNQG